MKLVMKAGSYYAPKENIIKPEGDDAHFISHKNQTIGIADGVGGTAIKGINSGIYSRMLMENSLAALADLKPDESVDPITILRRAYDETKVKGSSTACIVTLTGNKLRFANVGDSGFSVFRKNRCVYTLPVQQRRFNHPYHLRNGSNRSRPECAYVDEFAVEANDVVVVGTDGLFDNLYSSEIEKILSQTEADHLEPEKLASTIGDVALGNSVNRDYVSPFQKAAAAANLYYYGGKYDDITVVVARIQSLSCKFPILRNVVSESDQLECSNSTVPCSSILNLLFDNRKMFLNII